MKLFPEDGYYTSNKSNYEGILQSPVLKTELMLVNPFGNRISRIIHCRQPKYQKVQKLCDNIIKDEIKKYSDTDNTKMDTDGDKNNHST